MASKKLPRGTPEFEMFGEFYNLVQEFYEVEDTDEYWEGFISKADQMIKKYKNVPLCRRLIDAFEQYLEHNLKERRENNGNNS